MMILLDRLGQSERGLSRLFAGNRQRCLGPVTSLSDGMREDRDKVRGRRSLPHLLRSGTRRARCIMYSPKLSGFAVVRRRVGWSPLTGW